MRALKLRLYTWQQCQCFVFQHKRSQRRRVMDLSLFWVLLARTVFLSNPSGATGASIQFDFQNYLENSDIDAIIPRSNASGQQSVVLKAGHYAEISFCLPVEATVTVEDVRYSNDGEGDNVPVFINEELVGSFDSEAHTDWGNNWNLFLSSGVVGEPKRLPPGFHKVQFSLNQTDAHGVELDTVQLNVDIPDFKDEEYLRCEKCLDRVVEELDYDEETGDPVEGTGAVLLLQNQGLITSEDGQTVAAIDMFPRPLVPCRVVTVTPWYVGDSGSARNAGTQTVIWQIGNEDRNAGEFSDTPSGSIKQPFEFVIGTPDAEFLGTIDTSLVNQFQVSFNGEQFPGLLSIPNGLAYVEISLVAPELPVNVSVQALLDDNEMSPPLFKTFDHSSLKNAWQFAVGKLGLDPLGQNRLEIAVEAEAPTQVAIDYIRLFVSDRVSENPVSIDAQQFSIEAISSGDPANPDRPTMAVSGINSTPVNGADAIVVNLKPNGGLDTVPIFELTQDGSISLTSPILGQFLPPGERSTFKLAPGVAGVRSVDVNPTELSMNVTFLDNSTVNLLIDATSETAEFTITGANVNIDTETSPLVRFIAPWTSDATNGVDTIVTNGRTVNQLTNGWETQEASTVDFINRCADDGVSRLTFVHFYHMADTEIALTEASILLQTADFISLTFETGEPWQLEVGGDITRTRDKVHEAISQEPETSSMRQYHRSQRHPP